MSCENVRAMVGGIIDGLRTRRRNAALAALSMGLSVGALVFIAGAGGTSPSSASASGARAMALPATLDGYRDILTVIESKSKNSRILAAQRAHESFERTATVAAYTKAFGGAPAAYMDYANDGLTRTPWAIAVRADAPQLEIGPIPDLKYLGVATPPQQVVTVGPVSCEVAWTQITPLGKKPDSSSEETVMCERTGSGVTAYVGSGGFTGTAGLNGLAAFATAAWVAAGRR
jgi:hypothetical protein